MTINLTTLPSNTTWDSRDVDWDAYYEKRLLEIQATRQKGERHESSVLPIPE